MGLKTKTGTVKTSTKAAKATKEKKEKRITIKSIINGLLDAAYPDLSKVSFEKAQKMVLAANPDSAFNEGHLSWYKNKYRAEHGMASPRGDKKNATKKLARKVKLIKR